MQILLMTVRWSSFSLTKTVFNKIRFSLGEKGVTKMVIWRMIKRIVVV